MAKNVGEYDELRIKLRLIELRDHKSSIIINGRTLEISSVKLEKEFLPLPKNTNLRNMNDKQIEILANQVGAGKAKGSYKADVYINGEGYSVKSHRSAPPAIVNHTPRWGWARICKELNIDIRKLDQMVEQYFNLREKNIISEDVYNTDPNSPFAKEKDYLRPLLNYFLFTGSGAKKSPYPAKYVLDCENPYDINTWKIHDKNNYLNLYWDKMKFSMRNKGFEAYPYTRNKDLWKNALSKPWAKKFNGTLKGSLHVRVN